MPGEPTPTQPALVLGQEDETPQDYVTIGDEKFPIRPLGRMNIKQARMYNKLYQEFRLSPAYENPNISDDEAAKELDRVFLIVQGQIPTLTMDAFESLEIDELKQLIDYVIGRMGNFTPGRQAPATEPTAQTDTTNTDGQLSLTPSPLPTTTPDTVTTNG